MTRLWTRDVSLWKSVCEHPESIAKNSLGWLGVTEVVRKSLDDLDRFAESVEGFSQIVLIGMGGSSLGAEVFRQTHIPIPGHPELIVLDSTVPAAIRRVEKAIDLANTLFVVATKSGTTVEPSVLYAYFYDLVKTLKGERAGDQFVAITDPGTLMEAIARDDHFRKIVLNPPDLGGRYSVLSFFGMLPAALMGLDVKAILDRADAMASSCGPDVAIEANPGARLGSAIAGLAKAGKDKLTLICSPPLESLGLWIEQLVAESTGKDGKGILPVVDEPLGAPTVYGSDRLFLQIRTADSKNDKADAALELLAEAGHPVITHVLRDTLDLGAEFFRWEIATALAGLSLGLNPFDQPDVRESKDQTKALLQRFAETGTLAELETIADYDGITLSTDESNRKALLLSTSGGPKPGKDGVVSILKAHFSRVRPGDYVAITGYFDEGHVRDRLLQVSRRQIRDTLRVATTTGFGPRFLHSTGQLHKGGPSNGLFLQLTADDGADLPIPGEPFGFATLLKAQALGDFQALSSRGRRALRVHLGDDVERGLTRLSEAIQEAIGARPSSPKIDDWRGF